MILTPNDLLIGMVGGNVSNYDGLLDRELSDLIIRPSISIQLRHQLIRNAASVTIGYENRYGESRYCGQIDIRNWGGSSRLEAIQSDLGHEFRVGFSIFF